MFWIFLAVAANLVWAFAGIGDKYVVSKRMKDPYVYLIWFVVAGALMSAGIVPFIDFQFPGLGVFLWLVLCAFLYFFAGLPYIRAMQIEEPTRISILWNTIPLFSLLLGWSFFDETFTAYQLLAFAFLVSGAFIVSVHAGHKKFKFSKALPLMLVSSFGYALYGVAFHHVVKNIAFLNAFVWIQFLMFGFVFTVFLHSGFRKSFKKEIKKLDKSLAGLVFGVSFLDNFGMLINQWALVFGTAALVYAFEGTQVLFIFIIATILSIYYPHIVKEKIDKKNIILKLVALVFMIVGVVILSLG